MNSAARHETIRTVQIVAGLEDRHGGPSYSVPRLCRALADVGSRTTLLSVADTGKPVHFARRQQFAEGRYPWNFARVPILSRLRMSSGLNAAMWHRAPRADIFHNHGLWLTPNVVSAHIAKRARLPLVLSPRGMLGPEALAFSRFQKRLFWHVLQKPALDGLACVHVTSRQEYEEIRSFGLTAPAAIIPNGVDLPSASLLLPPTADCKRTILFVGRLHPKKSLDTLIRAWASLDRDMRAGWVLHIQGPDENGYAGYLGALADSFELNDVRIDPPIYGDTKFLAMSQATLFVLPTKNENFGQTVAEALACKTPVICSRGAPWSGLEANKCGWWPPHGVEPLANAMSMAMTTPDSELLAMGERGRNWVAQDFSWKASARKMVDVYQWLAFGRERPECVVFD